MEKLSEALDTLVNKSGWGGNLLLNLLYLGPEKYDALSGFLHAFGLCEEAWR